MKTRILLFLFGTIFTLGLVQAASATTVTVNAIPNDNIDDSAAIQQAIYKTLADGGGTVVFPSGVLDVNRPITGIQNGNGLVSLTIKGDGGSIVRVSIGGENTAFTFGNLNQLRFENMIFVGKNVPVEHPQFIDARYIIVAHFVTSMNLSYTSFFGIAVPSPGALVHTTTNLTVDHCLFEGLNAGYPDGAVISLDCCTAQMQNSRVSGSTFKDYAHLNGQYFSKTPAVTGNWIRVRQTFSSAAAVTQNLTVEDTFFDEGAVNAIDAQNLTALNVRGIKVNVNSLTDGIGIKAENIKRVRIEDSIFGYTQAERPLGVFMNSTVEMIGITRREQALCPQVDKDSAITWRLSDCQ